MRRLLPLLLCGLSGLAWGEACVVHSQAERLDVKVCQQNRSIPPNLFRTGFCQPQLKGQKSMSVSSSSARSAPLACVAMPGSAARHISRISTTTAWPKTPPTSSRSAKAKARACGWPTEGLFIVFQPMFVAFGS